MSDTMLPNMFGWDYRQPTAEECELVGRDENRRPTEEEIDELIADGNIALLGFGPGEVGDSVVVTASSEAAQVALAVAFEEFGLCSRAHVIPAGIYLEGLSERA